MHLRHLFILAAMLCVSTAAWADDYATIDEGDYYIQVDGEYKFWTRGGAWGTEAVKGEHGVVFTVISNGDGTYTLQTRDRYNATLDGYGYLSGPTSAYTDSNSPASWSFEATDTDGTYYIVNSNSKYVNFTSYTYNDYSTYYYTSETSDQSSASTFTLLSEDEYETLIQKRIDGYAAAAAEAAGIDAETEDALADSVATLTATDYTGYITDADCSAGSGWTLAGMGYNGAASYNSGAIETWNCSGTGRQTISGLPEGLYKLTAQAFSCPVLYLSINTDSVSNVSYLFASTATSESKKLIYKYESEDISADAPSISDLADGTDSTFLNILYIYVADGEDLEIGYVQEGNCYCSWTVTDTWTLTRYTEAASVGSATASITDGALLSAFDGTVTVTWSASESTASLLSETATATLTDSSGDTIATGTISAATDGISVSFSGYTLTDYETYTITIPDSIYGWEDGDQNTEVSVSFVYITTPEGDYYLRTTDEDGEYVYLSRGHAWSTRAVTDAYGIPFTTANTTSGTTVYFADMKAYLFDANTGNVFTDNSTYPYWAFEPVDGGYVLKNLNTNSSGSTYGNYVSLTDGYLTTATATSAEEATVWVLEDFATHLEQMQAVDDANAAAVAEQAGLSGIASVSDLEDAVADYTATSVSLTSDYSTISETYQVSPSQSGSTATARPVYTVNTQTMSLEAGLYKFSAQAFQRISWNGTLDGGRNLVFLNAGDQSTQVMSLLEGPGSETQRNGTNDYSYNGLYYANDTSAAGLAFDEDEYTNDVWFYVEEAGEVTLSLTIEVYQSTSNGSWVCYRDYVLTQYTLPDSLSVTIGSGGYATLYYGDRDLTVADSVTAYTASTVTFDNEEDDEVGTITLNEVSGGVIPAGTAVVLAGTAGTYSFAVASPTASAIEDNILLGSDGGVEITDADDEDHYYYVLGYSTDQTSMGFYYSYTTGHRLKVGAHKAYLQLDADEDSEVKGFRFTTGTDEATGISNVNAGEAEALEGIYTLTGIRMAADDVEALPTGLYIINGKKVLVK